MSPLTSVNPHNFSFSQTTCTLRTQDSSFQRRPTLVAGVWISLLAVTAKGRKRRAPALGSSGSQISALAVLTAKPVRTKFPAHSVMSSLILRGSWYKVKWTQFLTSCFWVSWLLNSTTSALLPLCHRKLALLKIRHLHHFCFSPWVSQIPFFPKTCGKEKTSLFLFLYFCIYHWPIYNWRTR